MPWFGFLPRHEGHIAIVGGSPSLKDKLEEIGNRKALGQEIWALNGAHDYLIKNGIIPSACVFLDARKDNAVFVKNPHKEITYYVASQCHPSVFDALGGYKVVVYHNNTPGAYELLEKIDTDKPTHLFNGGTTVGMKAMVLAHRLGFKHIHLYGMDSSYRNDEGHAYAQPLNAGERILDVLCGEESFKCAPWMITQAQDFQQIADELAQDDCIITVAGDGLLPHLARMMMNPTGVINE